MEQSPSEVVVLNAESGVCIVVLKHWFLTSVIVHLTLDSTPDKAE